MSYTHFKCLFIIELNEFDKSSFHPTTVASVVIFGTFDDKCARVSSVNGLLIGTQN